MGAISSGLIYGILRYYRYSPESRGGRSSCSRAAPRAYKNIALQIPTHNLHTGCCTRGTQRNVIALHRRGSRATWSHPWGHTWRQCYRSTETVAPKRHKNNYTTECFTLASARWIATLSTSLSCMSVMRDSNSRIWRCSLSLSSLRVLARIWLSSNSICKLVTCENARVKAQVQMTIFGVDKKLQVNIPQSTVKRKSP